MKNKTGNEQIATKKDIKELRTEILRVEVRVENIEESQKRVEAKLDRIANTLDGFVGRVDDLTVENKVGCNQTRETRLQVDNHEKRIRKLESSTHAAK